MSDHDSKVHPSDCSACQELEWAVATYEHYHSAAACANCGHLKEYHKLWAGRGNAYCFATNECECKDYEEA